MTLQKPIKIPPSTKNPWFERVMAAIACLNLLLVFFDLSYIPWRDFYLKNFPAFTQWYGTQFKGIEPDRSTAAYLETVSQLEEQVDQTGLQSPATRELLDRLRTQSRDLIDENPFQVANKSGTLERIKNRMRDRTGAESSKLAFDRFWSEPYLSQTGWNASIGFFNAHIRPLIATNYFRGINEQGNPIDRFWRIDLSFMALFAIEFLARTFYLSRRYRSVNWLDAMFWRWYDLPLLLPFWRWLRVIPVTIRLDQARLIDLEPISDRIIKGFVANIGVELTEVVVVQIINQVQDLIQQGVATRWLLNSGRRYIDLNNINEVEVISQRLIQLVTYQVLPKIRPELEALMQHILQQALSTSPVYANLQRLPGMSTLSDQLTKQIVTDVSKNTYQAITTALEDPVGTELVKKLVDRFGTALRDEAQQSEAILEIQSLAAELLDEVKVNYVKRIADEDIEELRANSKRLYEITKR